MAEVGADKGAEPELGGRRRLIGVVRRLAEWYFELAHRTIVAGAILFACRQITDLSARTIEILTVSFLGVWTVATATELARELFPGWRPQFKREGLSWQSLVALAAFVAAVAVQVRLVGLVMSVVEVLAKRAE